MGERRGASAAIAALLIVALAACTPEAAPAPPPSPSVVSSEDAAFAAAEATYRAYVDAVNASRVGGRAFDPELFLTGSALEGERRSQLEFDQLGIRLDGDLRLASMTVSRASGVSLRSYVCLDVSNTRVLDEAGVDVTPKDREALLGLEVAFVRHGDATLISESQARDDICS